MHRARGPSQTSSRIQEWGSQLRSIAALLDLWVGSLWEQLTSGATPHRGDLFVAWTDRTVGLGLTRSPEPEMSESSILGRLGLHAVLIISQFLSSLTPPAQLATVRVRTRAPG